jgi:hypothetical protein
VVKILYYFNKRLYHLPETFGTHIGIDRSALYVGK